MERLSFENTFPLRREGRRREGGREGEERGRDRGGKEVIREGGREGEMELGKEKWLYRRKKGGRKKGG